METETIDYRNKFERIAPHTDYGLLPLTEQRFVRRVAGALRLTQQELRQLSAMALDRIRWKELPLSRFCDDNPALLARAHDGGNNGGKKQTLSALREQHARLQGGLNRYDDTADDKPQTRKPVLKSRVRAQLGLGRCPVASAKTRCCNLLTLDAVEKCGFDCSYCSIQSFYHGNEVVFDRGFADKLAGLSLDPRKTYHIGTGQSSDSLMWGNHQGVLEALCDFARNHPNVILELKTKSKNIHWLARNEVPANVICTWSLNTPTLIKHEEHGSASLSERIRAAEQIAANGGVVGFHFHPIIHYAGWEADYSVIGEQLVEKFHPEQVALVSMGTLTYTKAVMKTIRRRDFTSKVLQMPLQQTAGKYSYPDAIKLELFRRVYGALQAWHARVFFYLCMEPAALWPQVFGFDYADNARFEAAMKAAYFEKINRRRPTSCATTGAHDESQA